MNWKTWVPLVLAIVLGVVAAKVARDVMLKNKNTDANAGKFTKVVVTKGDVAPGKELTAEDLTLAQVETANVPASSFAAPQEVVGRVSETLMVKGQPVVEAMLAPTGSGSGLQALVPPGQRAVTMEVNEFSGVAGLLNPGCRVDVIATINDGGGQGSQIAKTIVQNVKVTAVGQKTASAGPNEPPPPTAELFKSVTMLVKPEEAEAIELACSVGRPRLVLRGGRDNEVASTNGITLGELKGNGGSTVSVAIAPPPPTTMPSIEPTTKPAEAVAVRETPKRVVRFIRGGAVTNVTFDIAEPAPGGESTITDTRDPFDQK